MKGQKVQTIEQTGKKWKGTKLIGVLSALFGSFMVLSMGPERAPFGLLLMFGGGCIYIVGKIGTWWYHS